MKATPALKEKVSTFVFFSSQKVFFLKAATVLKVFFYIFIYVVAKLSRHQEQEFRLKVTLRFLWKEQSPLDGDRDCAVF